MTVLLHCSPAFLEREPGPARWAVGAAAQLGERLTALLYDRDGESSAALPPADGLLAMAREAGVDATARTVRNMAFGLPDCILDEARLHDWIVCSRNDDGLISDRAIADKLLMQSGRPVVLVPGGWDSFRLARVVVAWDYGRASARALGDSLPLLRRAGRVELVAFGDDKAFDTSSGHDRLVETLAARGVSAAFAERNRGSASIGTAILGAAEGADLLVMGASVHSGIRQTLFGGATREILQTATLPVLMSH